MIRKTTMITLMLIHWSSMWAQTSVQTGGDVWTLDQCITYAMTHATDIRLKKVEADNAREEVGAAAGGFMPSLSAGVGTQLSW